jgi:hypothetical protein
MVSRAPVLRQYLNTQRLPALVAGDRQFLIQIKDVAATPQSDEKADGCGLLAASDSRLWIIII